VRILLKVEEMTLVEVEEKGNVGGGKDFARGRGGGKRRK